MSFVLISDIRVLLFLEIGTQKMPKYTIGLDYGTNSVRAVVVNTVNGKEVASSAWKYEHGCDGILLSDDPNLARQDPADYLKGAETPSDAPWLGPSGTTNISTSIRSSPWASARLAARRYR